MREQALEQMKNVDIHNLDPASLVDIRDIQVNTGQSKEERMRDFIRQIGNPYCFRVGNVAVKVSFAEGGTTLEDRLESLMMKL